MSGWMISKVSFRHSALVVGLTLLGAGVLHRVHTDGDQTTSPPSPLGFPAESAPATASRASALTVLPSAAQERHLRWNLLPWWLPPNSVPAPVVHALEGAPTPAGPWVVETNLPIGSVTYNLVAAATVSTSHGAQTNYSYTTNFPDLNYDVQFFSENNFFRVFVR